MKQKKLHKSRVTPVPKEDMAMYTVMKAFTDGTLKDKNGTRVVSKEKAVAMALSRTGVTMKSMAKAELKNKLVEVRKALDAKLEKELNNDKAIRAEIIKFFRDNPQPNDTQMHGLAERLQLEVPELETVVYSILSDIISGGLSQGKDISPDPKELALGISVEAEHTKDKGIAEKIAMDHLSEDPSYYTKLKKMEGNG